MSNYTQDLGTLWKGSRTDITFTFATGDLTDGSPTFYFSAWRSASSPTSEKFTVSGADGGGNFTVNSATSLTCHVEPTDTDVLTGVTDDVQMEWGLASVVSAEPVLQAAGTIIIGINPALEAVP